MLKKLDLVLSPQQAFDPQELDQFVRNKLKLVEDDNAKIRTLKRSIDARSKKVKVNVSIEVGIKEELKPRGQEFIYESVEKSKACIIVGSGPAGLFAALRLIELGIKPIVIERGSDVRKRRRDLADINKKHIVNPESNYCFGEGGAGTYSDGKLYTRSKKRGDIQRILDIFVAHGATEDIWVDAHPHIGTNNLPGIVQALRDTIIEAGGSVLFDTKVIDFIIRESSIKGVVTSAGDKVEGIAVILATGHSARDIFELCTKRDIKIESKPFALGVRIEHSQQLIDDIQYRCGEYRGDYLPAASYSLVNQVDYNGTKSGVFSFCMCPGGFIVPSATAPGEVVVNGMSPSRRDSKFSNSGIVTSIDETDTKEFEKFGPLAGMYFQQKIEQKACESAGGDQHAPAQRMMDFVKNKESSSLLDTSYQPGLMSVDLRSLLPPKVAHNLKVAFKGFGKKMHGYLTNEAQIVGVESRTSSPVRIPRDPISFEHVTHRNLFPCGEGAGYAGGIVSAAMDGEKCAEKLVELYG